METALAWKCWSGFLAKMEQNFMFVHDIETTFYAIWIIIGNVVKKMKFRYMEFWEKMKMEKKVSLLLALMMVATVGLTGCKEEGREDNAVETVVTSESRLVSEDGWGNITSGMHIDSGNFTKLTCGMPVLKMVRLGYLSKNYADFSGNTEAETMDLCLHFYEDGVTSFDYSGEMEQIDIDPYDKKPYDAYAQLLVNGDTGELYAAKYMIGIADEAAGAALADSLFEKYDNGSGEKKTEHGYLIRDVEAFNGNVSIFCGKSDDGAKSAFIFRIYNEQYNNAPDFFEKGEHMTAETQTSPTETSEASNGEM